MTHQHILFTVTLHWHMVKDQSSNKRRNLLPPLHGLFFLISDLLYVPSPHTIAFVTSVVEHWLERETAWWFNCSAGMPISLVKPCTQNSTNYSLQTMTQTKQVMHDTLCCFTKYDPNRYKYCFFPISDRHHPIHFKGLQCVNLLLYLTEKRMQNEGLKLLYQHSKLLCIKSISLFLMEEKIKKRLQDGKSTNT